MTVCMRLAELLVKLFNCRSPLLCSETNVPDSPPVPHSRFRRPVLLARPFDDGPLARADPQEALTSTHDYLLALSKRPERVFGTSAAAPTGAGARDPTWAGAPLSDADVDAIRSTWNRLGSLIPYHSGGFYIPGSLSPEARHTAYSVLQSKEYGVRHGDMALPRFLVRWARPGDDTSDATLALTGWEHAARAPLWACARLPPWLVPSPAPHEPLDWPAQRAVRTALFQSVFRADALPHAQGWEWVVAHVFGATERWFEGVLGAHWAFRDTAEVLLVRLRAHWLRERPDVPFPLDVGGAYLARVWARLPRAPREPVRPKGMFVFGAEDASVAVGVGAEAEGVVSKTRSFVEEVRAAMGVLAGGLEIPQEVSWPQVRVEHRDDDVD
ncbi:hypothetical protein DENSPDRAFT_902959 [Dentipellis sp. KUC8613]|nr:hypothetical protein DENSPDRAFT_902959 [Dentipellis sp. KUC8613]